MKLSFTDEVVIEASRAFARTYWRDSLPIEMSQELWPQVQDSVRAALDAAFAASGGDDALESCVNDPEFDRWWAERSPSREAFYAYARIVKPLYDEFMRLRSGTEPTREQIAHVIGMTLDSAPSFLAIADAVLALFRAPSDPKRCRCGLKHDEHDDPASFVAPSEVKPEQKEIQRCRCRKRTVDRLGNLPPGHREGECERFAMQPHETPPEHCPTPEYHKTHRYCPSCTWTETA